VDGDNRRVLETLFASLAKKVDLFVITGTGRDDIIAADNIVHLLDGMIQPSGDEAP
jgi:hypothetical protein